jgi:heme O synthase-like polyprenyltransferase
MGLLSSSLVALRNRWRAYPALAKPDVTFLVPITTVAGFYLGSRGSLNCVLLLNTLWATMLVAALMHATVADIPVLLGWMIFDKLGR